MMVLFFIDWRLSVDKLLCMPLCTHAKRPFGATHPGDLKKPAAAAKLTAE